MKVQKVGNETGGINLAEKILYEKCNKNTVLFLSGGKTPKPLYEMLAKENKLKVGAGALVDDRYSLHEQYSNEFMVRESGLVKFLEEKNTPFYSILRHGLNIKQTASEYNTDVKFLLENFERKIAILGVGTDGHTAGILPLYNKLVYYTPEENSFVAAFKYSEGEFKERISLNFNALSEMDYLIVLVFGEGKKKALEEMFESGSIEQVPARFLVQKIPEKTILITDQKL